jgi:NifB/MoaA-like Fe-S oxidoreductase
MRKHSPSREEKIAKQIENIVSDLRVDLEEVGKSLARMKPNISYNRLMIIAEAAEFEKENLDVKNHHNPLF